MILTCLVTHDRLPYTQRCVESWLATRRKRDALVIVDNGSTDGTREWIEASGIRHILNPDNRYPGAACNQGWDYGLRFFPDFLHRSDNDIEYLPGWGDEIEQVFAEWPEVALLGVLNLHEDHGDPPADASGIVPADRVGGNVVMRADTFRAGLRWEEGPWRPGRDEDGPMSWEAKRYGAVARLARTVANNMAFNRYWDFPDYYNRTAAARGIADAEHSV